MSSSVPSVADFGPSRIAASKSLGRVAFLTNILPPYRLPAIRVLSKECDALRIFLSTDAEPNRSWNKEWSGLDVVLQRTITFSHKWRHPLGFEDPLFVHIPIDTVQQLRKFRPDVVLSGEMGFRTLLACVYRKLHSHSFLLIWADVSESTEQGRGLVREWIRRMLRSGADGFIVNGKSGQRYLCGLGVPEEKVFQVPYATDLQHFLCADVQRDPPKAKSLLYVGQFSRRKGLLPFLEALSHWCESNRGAQVEFTLLGEGPLRPVLMNTRVPSNLQLIFLKPLPYYEMVYAYRKAGILVFPTLADTWGLVVNEGMATGLPVLGSLFSPAVEELVEDNVNGWTFRPNDRDSVFGAIDRCMNTPVEELERMRLAAQSSAAKLSPEYVGSLVSQIIREHAIVHTSNTNRGRRPRA